MGIVWHETIKTFVLTVTEKNILSKNKYQIAVISGLAKKSEQFYKL